MQLEDIDKLAELARMEIPKDEKEKVLEDLSAVLVYVAQIQKIAVANVTPEYPLRNVFREDTNPTPSGTYTKEIIEEIPESQDGFLKVQQIL